MLTCDDHATNSASHCDMAAVTSSNKVVSVAHCILAIQSQLLSILPGLHTHDNGISFNRSAFTYEHRVNFGWLVAH